MVAHMQMHSRAGAGGAVVTHLELTLSASNPIDRPSLERSLAMYLGVHPSNVVVTTARESATTVLVQPIVESFVCAAHLNPTDDPML